MAVEGFSFRVFLGPLVDKGLGLWGAVEGFTASLGPLVVQESRSSIFVIPSFKGTNIRIASLPPHLSG